MAPRRSAVMERAAACVAAVTRRVTAASLALIARWSRCDQAINTWRERGDTGGSTQVGAQAPTGAAAAGGVMGTLAASTAVAVYDTATGAGAGGATTGVAGGDGAGSAAPSAAGATRATLALGTATAPTGSSGWMSGAWASIFSMAALCGAQAGAKQSASGTRKSHGCAQPTRANAPPAWAAAAGSSGRSRRRCAPPRICCVARRERVSARVNSARAAASPRGVPLSSAAAWAAMRAPARLCGASGAAGAHPKFQPMSEVSP